MSGYSGEALGWMAAICSMLAFGSFGAPIKSEAANSVDVDPLVFQSYKSFMCFATAWLVLLAGVPFTFTPWGIVSCIFWVPGGVATVFAIRNAGLAIAIGIGSSSIVLVSFVWGIFIFEERINSRFWACVAVAMMMTGILGMSYFSSPQTALLSNDASHSHDIPNDNFISMNTPPRGDEPNDGILLNEQSDSSTSINGASRRRPNRKGGYEGVAADDNVDVASSIHTNISHSKSDDEPQPPLSKVDPLSSNGNKLAQAHRLSSRTELCDSFTTNESPQEVFSDESPIQQQASSTIVAATLPQAQQRRGAHDPMELLYICGLPFTRRQVGIAGALFNGIWGGSIMVPMHYCHDDVSGTHYLISFGVGAAVVTSALWVMRFFWNLWYYAGNITQAYQALPSCHLNVMWCAGGTSGLLWSIGNFFSLISVYYLGEGVGYSVVQAGMLVSGLWGIFYFHEVRGRETIMKWFASAAITIAGIILLSYEHHKK